MQVLELRSAVDKELEFTNVTERQYKDQISERNRLLAVIYDYVNNLLSREQSASPSEVNSTVINQNFEQFYEKLLTRLRQVGKLCQSFEERAKAVESKGHKEFRYVLLEKTQTVHSLTSFEEF